MKRLCIIGAGEAGIALIKALKEHSVQAEITLIDKRKYYFDRKNLFAWWAKKSECEIYELGDFAQSRQIQFIQAKVERLNFNKRKVFLKEKDPFEYDELIVASGIASRDLSIKGDHREGFFYLSECEPYQVRDLLKISNDIIVWAHTVLGLRLALYLSCLKKEVRLIAGNLDFLGVHKDRFLAVCQMQRILLCEGVRIEEAIGEGSIKATRVSLPKVFSSQMLFVDSGFIPEDSLCKDIRRKDTFFTDSEGVYCLGEVTSSRLADERFFASNSDRVRSQAALFAKYLLTKEQPPAFYPYQHTPEEDERLLSQLLEMYENPQNTFDSHEQFENP